MARKFLYFIAFCIVVYMGGRLALQFFPEQISRAALVPGGKFEAQPSVAANAYADPLLWMARPGLGARDPARFLPDNAVKDEAPVKAAVFFVHPTSYMSRDHWNAPLDDTDSQTLANRLVRGLASAFNASSNLWAPQYRQATFGAFLTEAPETQQALDLAYGDVARAFDQFLSEAPKDEPIVLVGHSQGAFHLRRLMREKVAGTPLAHRVAAVYAIGWPISLEHDLPLMGLPACTAPQQAGCVLSWMSFAEPAAPEMVLNAYARRTGLDGTTLGGSAFLCTNPLTGMAGGEAPASANLGTLVPDGEGKSATLKAGMAPARCGADGILLIGNPPELGPYVLPGNNYHVYDIPLFWTNVRADFARRVAAWKP